MGLQYPPRIARNYLYLPDGWNSRWLAAKAGVASSPARISIIGDSIASGTNATVPTCFPEKLITALKGSYGTYADFYSTWFGKTSPTGDPWTATTGEGTTGGAFSGCIFSSSTTGVAYQTFTTPYACTALDFLYLNAGGFPGTWGYSVDGGSTVTVTNNQDGAIHKVSITGLANAVHTFAWGFQSANATVFTLGCTAYNPGAAGGIAAARFGGNANAATEMTPSTFAGTGASASNIDGFPVGSDLLIFENVTNDIAGANSITTLAEDIDQCILAFRRAQPDCSVLFVLPKYPIANLDDVSSGFANQTIAYQYHQQIWQLAQHHCCAVFDVGAKWGANPFGKGFMANNNLHPNASGHLDIYNTLLPIL